MTHIKLVRHAKGAPGLRLLGLGPNLLPSKGLLKLSLLLNKHAFWAKGRKHQDLRELLKESSVVISLWRGKRLVGFGRATSDGIYRAVLWDIVVAGDLQGKGLGRKVIDSLLASSKLKRVEKIYFKQYREQVFFIRNGNF